MNIKDLKYKIAFNFRHPEKFPLMFAEKLFSAFFDRINRKHELKFKANGLFCSIKFRRNAITEHLHRISDYSCKVDGLMVELGTNAGHSTRAMLYNSSNPLISVDIQDFSSLEKNFFKETAKHFDWHFVYEHDLSFSKKFHKFVKSRKLPSEISLLFIDTTHSYEDTLAELRAFVPLMKKGNSIILLHDTNLDWFYKRDDGTFGFAFLNRRGVARAIEKYFGFDFDEKTACINQKIGKKISITHVPTSCGLTAIFL